MNIVGIVCEYNPFHKGHKYQIDKIKEMYSDSLIAIVTSTNFTERGEISVLNKEQKTKIALNNGVDIVIELPFPFATSSADKFAYASLKLLNEIKIDTLVFGSESNNIDKLSTAANIQINNKEFDSLVKEYMDKGNNYPSSLSKAIYDLTKIKINESNDLLAVSYIKEIIKNNYNIKPIPIKRTNNFKENKNKDILSAYEIRSLLKDNKNVSKYITYDEKYIENINYNKYFELLKYSILINKDNLKNIHLIDEGIENRIYESALKSNSLEELIENIKTKRYTYNKINRILTNIYTNFTKEDASNYNDLEYIRILGMTSKGKKYLNSIKKEINLPLLTKFENYKMLNLELKITNLYNLLCTNKIDEIKYHVIIKQF